MNKEKQRVKIAEALGWTGPFQLGWIRGADYEGGDLYGFVGTDPSGELAIVPDFLNDLNACADMEKVLEEYFPDYYRSLKRVTFDGSPHCITYDEYVADDLEWWGHAIACASHRCEAFLRTLNLWEESV